jgi:hypothetical protein
VSEPTGGQGSEAPNDPQHVALETWFEDLVARTAPPRLRVEEGETVEDAAERVLDLEERRVRSSSEDTPEMRSAKFEVVASLRKKLGLLAQAPGARTPTAPFPGEATYELTLGGIEGQPLGDLADLLHLWYGLIDGALGERTTPARRRRFRHAEVELVEGEKGARELVVWFTGTREMIAVFTKALRDSKLTSE